MYGSEYNERTLLANILYSDTEAINKETLEKILRCTKEQMFFDRGSRYVYKLLKEQCQYDIEIIGTKQFVYKLKQIADIEYPSVDLNAFIQGLKSYWSGFTTILYWVRKIQENYFSEQYKAASSQEEFETIIKEKQELSIEPNMGELYEDAADVIKNYEVVKKSAVFTPFESLNKHIGSLQGGDVIILAGSTGGGKTCFMLNLAVGMAKLSKKVDIFSLEMPRKQLQQRIICSQTDIESFKFRDFSLTEEDKKKYISYANNEFRNLKIRIYKKQTVSINEIKYIVQNSDSDIVFIDYLGLIDGYKNKNTYDKFSDISRDIKLLAMSANKPIIALHQLNRDYQKRDDKRPQMSDIRDSGKIEQDADMIWFVYRPALFDETKYEPNDLRVIIAKDRFGEPNKEVNLDMNSKLQKITERKVNKYSLNRN